jgi:hypothetical protein
MQYAALRTAVRHLVQELGGIDAASTVCRVGRSQISDYQTPHGDKFMPLDVVMQLEASLGQPVVTTALALAAGCTLLPLNPLAERSALAALLARIGKDTGELFGTAAQALGHAKPTPAERTMLLAELSDLHLAVGQTISFLQNDGAA